jgi:hypothetical protein
MWGMIEGQIVAEAGSQTGATTLAVIALAVTTVNASVAITNFLLTRIRLPRLRYVGCSYVNVGRSSQGEHTLTVDILNYGAAIWEMEVWIEIFVPLWAKNVDKNVAGIHRIQLHPVGKQINPLNGGQAMEFNLTTTHLNRHALPGKPSNRDFYGSLLGRLSRRYMSLCIYSNGKRVLLRRVRSRRLHWELDFFFGAKMKLSPPLRNKLFVTVFNWSRRKSGQSVKSRLDKWRLGYFDMWVHRISRSDSPEQFRPEVPRLHRPPE